MTVDRAEWIAAYWAAPVNGEASDAQREHVLLTILEMADFGLVELVMPDRPGGPVRGRNLDPFVDLPVTLDRGAA